MALKEKLAMFNLSPEQEKIATSKFLATLALVSEEELKEITSYLNSQGVEITRANQIKLVGNLREEIAKKFSIIGEIHETEIYKQDPLMINRNVIDIYKKIQYCKQNGISYKKEDGTYESFLFSELEWQKVFNRESVMISEPVVAAVLEEPKVEVSEPIVTPVEPIAETTPVVNFAGSETFEKDTSKLDAKTQSFKKIREELAEQLAALDAIRNNGEIGFNDIDTESFGMGRAA